MLNPNEFQSLPEKKRVEYSIALYFTPLFNKIKGTTFTPYNFGADDDGVDYICQSSSKKNLNLQITVLPSVQGQVAINAGRGKAALSQGWTLLDGGYMSPTVQGPELFKRLRATLETKFRQRPGSDCALVVWHMDELDTHDEWIAQLEAATPLLVPHPNPYQHGAWLFVGRAPSECQVILLDPYLD